MQQTVCVCLFGVPRRRRRVHAVLLRRHTHTVQRAPALHSKIETPFPVVQYGNRNDMQPRFTTVAFWNVCGIAPPRVS